MRRLNLLLGCLLSLVLLQACVKEVETDDQKKAKENDEQIRQYIASQNLTFEAAPSGSGLYYAKTETNPGGRAPATGDQISVHYVGKLLNGTAFDSSSVTKNKPLIFALNNGSVIPGFNEGISLLKEGEKAKLLIPSYLAYGRGSSQNIPAYSALQFDVSLVNVRTEDELLSDYNVDSSLNATRTSSGLYYAVRSAGNGIQPTNGKKITVKYRGYFVDGREFAKASTHQFVLGSGQVIKGWDEGIALMKVNEKATFLIPSTLAYGKEGSPMDAQGRQVIPPYTPLVYEVELVTVE